NWEKFLEDATYAVNISYNRSIRTSPMIFKYGHIPDLKIDKELGAVDFKIPLSNSILKRNLYYEDYIKKSIEKGKITCKYDLDENDNVAIFKQTIGDKLKSKWRAGYKVLGKQAPDAYMVTDGKRNLRVNKRHIKKIYPGANEM
ncbi:hypothetical protein H311_03175, partial [Anncaliia algerae PRA109]